MSYSNENSPLTLHAKLNEVIHPIWNQIRMENEVFYQKAFSRVLAQDLLPALNKSGKSKPLEAVMDLILIGLGKMDSINTEEFKGLNFFL
jgi:hypothetical protein